jgi:mRNA-degrading endonuclease RelE of RelBE toxin-antitoxin system
MLAHLDPDTYEALRSKLLSLGVANPYASAHLKSIGKNSYRVRQGDWRALILIRKDQRAVLVDRVVRKNEATYR